MLATRWHLNPFLVFTLRFPFPTACESHGMFFPAAVAVVLLFFFRKTKTERGWSQFPVESKTLLMHPVPRYLSDWTVCARLLYTQVDIISSLLSGRLVREKVGPAVQSAVQSQVGSHSTSPPKCTKDYTMMRCVSSRPLLPSCVLSSD